jgi:hypothetical protein
MTGVLSVIDLNQLRRFIRSIGLTQETTLQVY